MFGKERKDNPEQPRRKRHFLAYKRRWALWGSVVLLVGGTIAYNIATDDERVRRLVEKNLNAVLGGQIKVERAEFSIFRGLSVENVTLSVDGDGLCDSRFLHAGKLNLVLRHSDLLRFKLSLDRIEAQEVNVLVCEDMETHTFNIHRLLRHLAEHAEKRQDQGGAMFEEPTSLPTISISNAKVTYARKRGTELTSGGDLQIDATIMSMPLRRYSAYLIARTPGSETATTAIAMFDRRTGEVTGRVSDLRFDEAVPSLLPSAIERFLRDLAFAGRFSVPKFRYSFPRDEARESFEIALAFDGVQAQVQPRHWLTRNETRRMRVTRETIKTLGMLGIGGKLSPGELAGDASDDASPLDLLSYLQLRSHSVPLRLDRLSGKAVFTNEKISIDNLRCRLQNQPLVINGYLSGYDADAPAFLHIQTAPGTFLQIPPSRQFITWLPDEVRKVYTQFYPQGKAALDIELNRESAGGDLVPSVQVDISEASFVYDDFPYPLRQATGRLIFKHDTERNQDVLRFERLRGRGSADGPNADSFIEINGVVGPFIGSYTGVDLTITGQNISSEPPLRKAFPREVRKAMEIFGPLDTGQRKLLLADPKQKLKLAPEEIWEWPRFSGNFSAHILRPPGKGMHWTTDIQLDIRKASGALIVFPYPMENVSCVLKILDDQLTIQNLQMKRGDASLQIDGTVKFTDPANPDLQVRATNVPIESELLNALPPTERSWIQRAGLGGHVDIAGRVFLAAPTVAGKDPEVDFDLDLKLRDAVLLKNAPAAFSHLNGDLFLKPARLDIHHLTGQRGAGTLSTSGQLSWADGTPDIQLKLNARDLMLDKSLRAVLPASVQESWDQQKPAGTTDLDLDYTHLTPGDEPDVPSPTTQPVEKISLAIRPRKLSATPSAFPYRLDDLQGEILLNDQKVELKNVSGRHGTGSILVNGVGTTGPEGEFRLKLSGSKLQASKQLFAAMPSSLADVFTGLKAAGQYDFKVDNLYIRPAGEGAKPKDANPGTPAATASTRPTTRPSDIDFDCTVSTSNGQIDIAGVPMTDMVAWIKLAGEIRSDQIAHMDGNIGATSYKLAGRDGSDFSASIRRPMLMQKLLIDDLKTTLAGGTIAGGITLLTPEKGPWQYGVEMVAQNVEVPAVTGDTVQKPIHARGSASLNVDGVFNDPTQRRGRGDVRIQGQNMIEAPILLGLFRVVNLTLPVRDGVNEVQLSYVLTGDKVTVENVEMRSPGLRIYGDGTMDFASRKLDFTLNTESPNALAVKIPLIGELVKQAQKELLQIRVIGTISEPQVKASSFPTFQATLNEVVSDVKRGRK